MTAQSVVHTYRERLTRADFTWLRMERWSNPMMITGVLTFDRALEPERLRERLAELTEAFPRFRCRPVTSGSSGPRWEEVARFDLDDHLERETLPAPADRRVLRERISAHVSTPLPFDRPLWKFHLLDNPTDGRAVLLARIHHAVADGFALLHVMDRLTDPTAEGRPLAANDDGPGRRRPDLRGVALALRGVVREVGLRGLVERTQTVGRDVARLLRLPAQPPSQLRGRLGSTKQAAWSAPVALPRVKATGRALGGTINDVLMAGVAGAFRRYLHERGEDPAGFDLRTVIPVNLRSAHEMRTLGNRFGLVFLDLPLWAEEPAERFRVLKARMDALKRSPEPVLLWRVIQAVGALPRWAQEQALELLGSKTTAMMTNVPGPRQTRYLAGEPIRTIMFWAPQSGRVGVGISVFSYAGEVRLGLSADALRIPQPEAVLDLFPDELERLATAAGLPAEA